MGIYKTVVPKLLSISSPNFWMWWLPTIWAVTFYKKNTSLGLNTLEISYTVFISFCSNYQTKLLFSSVCLAICRTPTDGAGIAFYTEYQRGHFWPQCKLYDYDKCKCNKTYFTDIKLIFWVYFRRETILIDYLVFFYYTRSNVLFRSDFLSVSSVVLASIRNMEPFLTWGKKPYSNVLIHLKISKLRNSCWHTMAIPFKQHSPIKPSRNQDRDALWHHYLLCLSSAGCKP